MKRGARKYTPRVKKRSCKGEGDYVRSPGKRAKYVSGDAVDLEWSDEDETHTVVCPERMSRPRQVFGPTCGNNFPLKNCYNNIVFLFNISILFLLF